MIETRFLKNVVTFTQTILSFVLSRTIINIYNDIAWKYGNVTVKDFRKYEESEYKKNKLKLHIDFLNSVNPTTFYLHSFLLLTSTYIKRNPCRNRYILNKKIIFTDEGLQLTNIHS